MIRPKCWPRVSGIVRSVSNLLIMKKYFKLLVFLICWMPFRIRYAYYRKRHLWPNVIPAEEGLKRIIEEHLSISRIGDGELKIAFGEGIGFQRSDDALKAALLSCMHAHGKQNNWVLCIPDIFQGFVKYKWKTALFWQYNLFWNWKQWQIFQNKTYLDTQMSRFYMEEKSYEYSTRMITLWKSLWNGRNIVIVEGEMTRLGVGNDLFGSVKSLRRILAPSKNAFSTYEQLLATCIEQVDKDELILLALGPTATVLARALAVEGFQAVDIGHIDIEYEWYLQKAKRKVAVPNKYVNEVKIGRLEYQVAGDDEEYQSQIIARLP